MKHSMPKVENMQKFVLKNKNKIILSFILILGAFIGHFWVWD